VPITLDHFKECLTKSGLLTPAEFAAFQQGLPADQRPADAAALSAELLRQKKLTPYQASVLAQGQAKGLVFGEYTVTDKLGEGGMGVVLQAEHRYLKRTVALKVLHPSVTQSEEAVKRFHREVEAMARLSHPNVVAAYDANQQDGIYYFVMELVDGIDLARLVKEQGLLSVDRALEYILQAARGLEHAHKNGVVHRDIKPSNLLLAEPAGSEPMGLIKILDMGLVRFTDSRKSDAPTNAEGLTQTGDIMGSFDYIAPEQAIDTKRADQRADIYSLGCTLHYLLVGRPPYSGDTSMQKLLAHRENPIPSLRKARPDVPLALDAVFHRMVAKKADDRYPSMTEVVADLEACRQSVATAPSERSTMTFALPPAAGSATGRLVLVCGTLCILAVVVANAVLDFEAAAHGWTISSHTIAVKWYALAAGAIMVVLGILISAAGSLTGSRLRAGQRPGETAWGVVRWLLAVFGGLIVGGIAGGAVGGALARNDSENMRAAGSAAVGAFFGAALGRRRAWLVVLGCGIAGYFVGTALGKYNLSLEIIGLPYYLAPDVIAMAGFGIVGAIVGAVLGAERREAASVRRSEPEPKSGAPARHEPLAQDGMAGGKTVRRLAN
jgi:serine/threonine protein kinase